MRAAIIHAAQIFDQFCVVVGIAFMFARVVRRIDTGISAQRVNTNARVVGERWQAGVARCVARLRQCVFNKGEVGLRCFRHVECALRQHLYAEWCQQPLKFFEFFWIAGGDDEFGNLNGHT